MVFLIRTIYCAFFVRVRFRVRVCLMHVISTTMFWVKVRVRFRVFLYAHNLLHVLKVEEYIRIIVLLSSYVYMFVCESVYVCVQVIRCIYMW